MFEQRETLYMGLRQLRAIWLGAACLLAFVFVAAFARRHLEHQELRQHLLRYLEPIAERGKGSFTACIDQRNLNRKGQLGIPGSPLGLSVYLLNRGYANPPLIRSLLLCEARQGGSPADLCSRLSQHALRDYPADPLVQWAAGEFNYGDSEFAATHLDQCLRLASQQPGGLSTFCEGAGVKEVELRHDLAAALTMLGRWDDAAAIETPDPNWLQRHLLPDASPPDQFLKQYAPGQYRQILWRHKLEKVSIENYVKSRQPHDLVALTRQIGDDELHLKHIQAEQDKDPDFCYHGCKDLEDPTFLGEEAGELHRSKLVAFLMTKDWDQAEGQLKNSSGSMALQVTELLLALTRGRKLGKTAREVELAAKVESAKGRLLHPEYYEDGDQSDFGQQSTPAAEYANLAGLLPYLVRTDVFQDALKRSGRPLGSVLAELRAISQPGKECYYDNSNGALRWK